MSAVPSPVCHVSRRPAGMGRGGGGARGRVGRGQPERGAQGRHHGRAGCSACRAGAPCWPISCMRSCTLSGRVRPTRVQHAGAGQQGAPPTRVGVQVVGHKLLGTLLQLARQVARGCRRRLGPHAAGQHLGGAAGRRGGRRVWNVEGGRQRCMPRGARRAQAARQRAQRAAAHSASQHMRPARHSAEPPMRCPPPHPPHLHAHVHLQPLALPLQVALEVSHLLAAGQGRQGNGRPCEEPARLRASGLRRAPRWQRAGRGRGRCPGPRLCLPLNRKPSSLLPTLAHPPRQLDVAKHGLQLGGELVAALRLQLGQQQLLCTRGEAAAGGGRGKHKQSPHWRRN